jgi:hypothetical protein
MRVSRMCRLIGVACCTAAVGVLAVAPASAAGGFAGSWSATDTADGSRLTLSINGSGGHYAVREVDDAANVCGGAAAAVNGSGSLDGGVLVAPVTLVCAGGGNIFRHRIAIAFTYDATADQLIGDDGVVWHRSG